MLSDKKLRASFLISLCVNGAAIAWLGAAGVATNPRPPAPPQAPPPTTRLIALEEASPPKSADSDFTAPNEAGSDATGDAKQAPARGARSAKDTQAHGGQGGGQIGGAASSDGAHRVAPRPQGAHAQNDAMRSQNASAENESAKKHARESKPEGKTSSEQASSVKAAGVSRAAENTRVASAPSDSGGDHAPSSQNGLTKSGATASPHGGGSQAGAGHGVGSQNGVGHNAGAQAGAGHGVSAQAGAGHGVSAQAGAGHGVSAQAGAGHGVSAQAGAGHNAGAQDDMGRGASGGSGNPAVTGTRSAVGNRGRAGGHGDGPRSNAPGGRGSVHSAGDGSAKGAGRASAAGGPQSSGAARRVASALGSGDRGLSGPRSGAAPRGSNGVGAGNAPLLRNGAGVGASANAGREGYGPIHELHLPDAPDNHSGSIPGALVPSEMRRLVVSPKAHHGEPFTLVPNSVGSLSERGNIPWAPDDPKKIAMRALEGAGKIDGGGDGSGLLGEYFLGKNFEQPLFRRPDPNIDFNWTGRVVDPRMPTGNPFSVRWTGKIRPRYSETYTFYTASDDGVRLNIDGQSVISNWSVHPASEDTGAIDLQAGREYPIVVEYFEKNGRSRETIKLYWESAHQVKEYVPESCLVYPKAKADGLLGGG